MDDNAKNISSYQSDQEILDARGIDMTVEEVAGLSTCKYSERVQALKVTEDDLAFLKGLRRRIKNRLASQNSRRRNVEHLRRLTRELRAVRACRDDALAERRTLMTQREAVRDRCIKLRRYIVQALQDRLDNTSEIPSIDIEITRLESPKTPPKIVTVTETKTPLLPECFKNTDKNAAENSQTKIFGNSDKIFFASADSKIIGKSESKIIGKSESKIIGKLEPKIFEYSNTNSIKTEITNSIILPNTDLKIIENTDSVHIDNTTKSIFECRIDKLVQKSVNHIYKNDCDKKKVFAKTVFISNEKLSSEIKSMVFSQSEMKILESDNGVLNLSLKEGRRKSHGRKQLAPRRIAYVYSDANEGVLDLKINKDTQ